MEYENKVERLTVDQFETYYNSKVNCKRSLENGVESQSLFNIPFSESDGDIEHTFLNNGEAPDTILITKFGVEIKKSTLQCLNPYQWLTDEVINFYIEMLKERETQISSDTKNWYFSSFLFAKLMENGVYNYDLVKAWPKDKNIFVLDSFSLPINITKLHWKMVYIIPTSKVIAFYDPLGPIDSDVENYGVHLLQWICDEYKTVYGKEMEDKLQWKFILLIDAPRQLNGFDCGMFCVKFAEAMSFGLSLHSIQQEQMPTNRLKLASLIHHKGTLLTKVDLATNKVVKFGAIDYHQDETAAVVTPYKSSLVTPFKSQDQAAVVTAAKTKREEFKALLNQLRKSKSILHADHIKRVYKELIFIYGDKVNIRRNDVRIKVDLLHYFLDPAEVSKYTAEKKNSPGEGVNKERKAVTRKLTAFYDSIVDYKDDEAICSGNTSPLSSSDSSEQRSQTADRFEYSHNNQSPTTVSVMQVTSSSQFLKAGRNGDEISELNSNELREVAKSGHAPGTGAERTEMDEDVVCDGIDEDVSNRGINEGAKMSELNSNELREVAKSGHAPGTGAERAEMDENVAYDGIDDDASDHHGDDEDASDHHGDDEDASEHHGDEEDSDDKDNDDDEDCFDDSNEIVTETNRRFTRSVAASRLLRKGVIEMQLNFDDEIASDSVEKRPLFTQFVKSKDLDKTPYDDSTSGLTSGSPDPKEEENVFCFEYIVCIKNGKTNNWVKNGTGTGFPKVCCSRYATVYPGKVLFIWFELPHADKKSKLLYEKLIQFSFREKGWIYKEEVYDSNEWKFLANKGLSDKVEDKVEDVVVSAVPSKAIPISKKEKGLINRSGNGEEFFLKYGEDGKLLIEQMIDIIESIASMTIEDAMKTPDYSKLKFGSEEQVDAFKRKANLTRQRLRPSRDASNIKAIDSNSLKFNKDIVDYKGYGAHGIVIEQSGGGCQSLDADGILSLSKFFFVQYNDSKVDRITILQIGSGYGEESICTANYLLARGVPREKIRIYCIDFTFHACEHCWKLVQQEGFADIISVDCRDLFAIDISAFESYEINFIASSASVNDLFYLQMMQVALQLKVKYYIVNSVYLKCYKDLGILSPNRKKSKTTFTQFICKAYVAPAKGHKPFSERNLHWISTSHSDLLEKFGSVQRKIKKELKGMNQVTFGHAGSKDNLHRWSCTSNYGNTLKEKFEKLKRCNDSKLLKMAKKLLSPNNTAVFYIPFQLCTAVTDKFEFSFLELKDFIQDDRINGKNDNAYSKFFETVHNFYRDKLKKHNYYICGKEPTAEEGTCSDDDSSNSLSLTAAVASAGKGKEKNAQAAVECSSNSSSSSSSSCNRRESLASGHDEKKAQSAVECSSNSSSSSNRRSNCRESLASGHDEKKAQAEFQAKAVKFSISKSSAPTATATTCRKRKSSTPSCSDDEDDDNEDDEDEESSKSSKSSAPTATATTCGKRKSSTPSCSDDDDEVDDDDGNENENDDEDDEDDESSKSSAPTATATTCRKRKSSTPSCSDDDDEVDDDDDNENENDDDDNEEDEEEESSKSSAPTATVASAGKRQRKNAQVAVECNISQSSAPAGSDVSAGEPEKKSPAAAEPPGLAVKSSGGNSSNSSKSSALAVADANKRKRMKDSLAPGDEDVEISDRDDDERR